MKPRPPLELPTCRPLGPAQAGAFARTARLHAALSEARRRRAALSGTLAWRPVRGVDQLVLTGPAGDGDGRTRTRILGARGPETEALAARADSERAAAEAALAEAAGSLAMQAAANRSAGLGSFPAEAGRALRALDGSGVVALGAGALAGYAAAAGCALSPGRGPDPLAPLRGRLVLAGLDAPGLCRRMRARGEAGFTPRGAGLAVGPGGYVVEAVPASAIPAGLAGPALAVLALDADGLPAPVACPPPAAFAAERLAAGQGDDPESLLALAQGRAAVACLGAGAWAGC